jgi:DeoR/GlpR family transcriptional regulator of sugar metabolism
MTDRRLKIDVRRNQILEMLRAEGTVLVSQLSRELGATPVTIRSDLEALEQAGQLVRIQGGAIPAVRPTARQDQGTISRVEEKKTIAQAVAAMIRDGDTLIINSGTTTQLVAEALKHHRSLNIVTDSFAVCTALGQIPTFRVLLLGGEVNAQYGFTFGGDAAEQLRRYRADWVLLSVEGVSAQGGLTTYHAEEAVIDRMMLAGASQSVIAVDQSKLGHTGFMKVCDCSPQLQIVTNKHQDSTRAEALRKCGLTVIEG